MRGRKPKPAAQKIAEGNPGHRDIPDEPPVGRMLTVDPPEGLSEDAREFWLRHAAILDQAGVLRSTDYDSFRTMAEVYAKIRLYERIIQEEGEFCEGAKGGKYLHPAASQLSSCRKELRAWLAEHGMTPSSRSRIHADKQAKTSGLPGVDNGRREAPQKPKTIKRPANKKEKPKAPTRSSG